VGREADVLLVPEGQDLDREGEGRARPPQLLDGDEARHHAERPVEAARVHDAVEMGADQERRRAGVGRLPAPGHGSEGVDAGVQPRRAEQAESRLRGGAVSRGEIEPGQARAVAVDGEAVDEMKNPSPEGGRRLIHGGRLPAPCGGSMAMIESASRERCQ
jgi:hypothetical protein